MALFTRFGSSLICMAFFWALIWLGFFKLALWHWPLVLLTRNRGSLRFVYHYTKALDQAACAGAFGGTCDETLSNKAGKVFKAKGFNAPWWVIFTKKLTDKWETDHIEKSIEPTRGQPEFLND